MNMQVVSVLPPPTSVVWKCRVYQFHHHQHQQFEHAGCISFTTITNTSSMDMQGESVSPPSPTPAVWTCRVYQFHHHQQHQQYEYAGCISFTITNTSSMDAQLDVQACWHVSIYTTSSVNVQGRMVEEYYS
jgi:hypothetical protein